MADETAVPVVSDEPVTTPVGDTEGTAVAVEQPQQQTAGADAADETPAVELSEEHRKSWATLPPEIRKQVNRIFTQKTQEIADERKKYGSYAQLAQALEADPDTTVELLAKHRGFEVRRPQAPVQTPQEQAVKDEHLAELEAQFGPAGAKAVLAVAEQIADRKAEARIKPLAEHHAQTQIAQEKAEATTAIEALTKEFPDWKQHEASMSQLAQKLSPGPGMSKLEYARLLYLGVSPNRTSAQTTKAVIDNLNRAAKAAETPAQAVPNNRVAKSRPQGLSFDKSFQAAAEAAGRGEEWQD